MTDDKHRRQWLAMLAKLTAPMDPETATKGLIAMLPMLADLDEKLFSTASLQHVAAAVKRVPSYGELRLHLGNWWRDNLPQESRLASEWTALPAPAKPAEPTPEERAAVGEVVRALRASTRIARSHAVADPDERPTPAYLTDHQLLVLHRDLAAKGSAGSAARVAHLERKLGIDPEAEIYADAAE